MRKVTIEVPAELLKRAQRSTGQGITATIRRGLEIVATRTAYEELRRLRGKVGAMTNPAAAVPPRCYHEPC